MSVVIGREIRRFAQVASTSDLARELAEQGADEGLVISAEEQIAGRGRLGRKWLVPANTSLQFSVILRPALEPAFAFRLTQMAALAVARTLTAQFSLQPILKWPNDVLLPIARNREYNSTYDAASDARKVAGILTESTLRGDAIEFCILGIGLNVNFSMQVYPDLAPFATTLQDVMGHAVDRAALEQALLAQLDAAYRALGEGWDPLPEYRARVAMLGQTIHVQTASGAVTGIASDIAPDGALVLARDGDTLKLYAGDVTIAKEPR